MTRGNKQPWHRLGPGNVSVSFSPLNGWFQMFVKVFNLKKTLQIVKILIIFVNHRIFLGFEPSVGEGTERAPPWGCTFLERFEVASLLHGHRDTQPSVISPALLFSFTHIRLGFDVIRMSLDCGRKQSDNPPCLRENTRTKHREPESRCIYRTEEEIKPLHDTKNHACCF